MLKLNTHVWGGFTYLPDIYICRHHIRAEVLLFKSNTSSALIKHFQLCSTPLLVDTHLKIRLQSL